MMELSLGAVLGAMGGAIIGAVAYVALAKEMLARRAA